MTDQPSEARKVAEAILAALDEECHRSVAEEHAATEAFYNRTPEEQEKTSGLVDFARGKQVGSYWAHDAARRVYREYFGEWPPNPRPSSTVPN